MPGNIMQFAMPLNFGKHYAPACRRLLHAQNVQSDGLIALRLVTKEEEMDMELDAAQRIRERAFGLWEAAGCPDGRAEEFWCQAEKEEAETALEQAPPKPKRAAKKPVVQK